MEKKEQNGQSGQNLLFEKKFAFDVWDDVTTKKAFDFCEGYKEFLDNAKTERLAVKEVEKAAIEAGFQKLEHIGQPNKKGFDAPLYSINRGKAIILAKPGKRPVSDGVRMILAHIDVSRLDLKMKPLYENEHIAFLKTQYYGAPKKYQWTNLPLAMYGTITKQDGSNIEIAVGDDKNDLILMITDIAPHLDKFQAKEKIDEAIPAETLNIVVGNIGAKGKDGEKDLVKKNILNILNQKYDISEEDFISADLEFVPVGAARDLGFDRSMISGYGHDDRSCSYDALEALINAGEPEYTIITVLVDREEIGSHGAASVQSNFIIDFISELLYFQTGVHDENVLRDTFFKSRAVSADTTFAFDPDYPEVFDQNNISKIGAGVAMEKYTGGHGKYYTSEATSEFTASMRNILNSNGVLWQTGGGGKIDIGGGGTMAMYLARLNMDVIDLSIPVLSVHAPFEIASKADIYSAYLAYKAFFESK
jgi:aspartyl aminopeptidase